MTTKGNLELRLGTASMFYCMSFDGHLVHTVVPLLAAYLDGTPSYRRNFVTWFPQAAQDVMCNDYSQGRMTEGSPEEVIIDADRRIILSTARPDTLELIGKEFSKQYATAVLHLKRDHNYRLLHFTNHLMRRHCGISGSELNA